MSENIAICEMFTMDIKTELSARQFELLDMTLDKPYRRWIEDRINALKFELMSRGELL